MVDVNERVEDVIPTESYQHDDFLTETCEGYDRDAFVEEEIDSENEDIKTKSNEFPIHNPNVPWNEMKPYIGEKYASVEELKTCLTNYAIANGLQLRYKRNSKEKLLVVCGPQSKGEDVCPWRLWASWMSTERSFQVKSLHDEHKCGRSYRLGSLVNSNWIAKVYGRQIRQNPSMKLGELKDSILEKYKCIVQIGQCRRAKAKALEGLEAALVDHYGKLWDYAEEIRRSNPGSTVKMSVEVGPDGKNYFKRFYVCLKGLRDGWLAGCRKFIGLDGCFLKTVCKGELLSAVGRDTNNHIYPFAWVVVEVECKDSWKWFLDNLMEDIGFTDGLGLTLMLDQHKGLVEAVRDVFPLAERRQCARHIYANFRKKFNGVQFRKLFWGASKGGTPEEFKCEMQKVKDLSREAYDHLMERDPKTWSRAFFKTDTLCDAVENGVSKCFNSLIVSSRAKPIITMLEEIRVFMMERVHRMSNNVQKWNGDFCPIIKKKLEKIKEEMRFWEVVPNGGDLFEAKKGLDGYVVDTNKKTCTCRIWQLSGIPCPHVVAVAYHLHQNPDKYVSPFLLKSCFINIYKHKVNPLNGIKLWPTTNFVKPLPPKLRRMPGRPPRSRKKDASESGSRNRINSSGHDEVGRKGRQMTCKNCWEVGHNSRGCKNEKKDAPLQKRKQSGRPKGSGSKGKTLASDRGSKGNGSSDFSS